MRIGTINILNDRSRWPDRRGLLAAQLAEANLDVICLQEVTDPLGPTSTAAWLAKELGAYEVSICPQSGWRRTREGLAILSRFRVEEHRTIDLGSQCRTAQAVRLGGDRPLVVANVHLLWPPGADGAQIRQVDRMLDWLPADVDVVLCGDFNALPGSKTVARIRSGLRSAHATRHGREPEFTCPTPLEPGGRAKAFATRLVYRLAGRPGRPWRGTLDYVFHSPGLEIEDCRVFLDRPDEGDPTLFASDHLGLVVRVRR